MLEIEEELDLSILGLEPVDQSDQTDRHLDSGDYPIGEAQTTKDTQEGASRDGSLGHSTEEVQDEHEDSVIAIDYGSEKPQPRTPRARLVRTRLPNSRRSRMSIRLLRRPQSPSTPVELDIQMETDVTRTDHTDTEGDTDATKISSLHPSLRPIAQVFGIEVAEKVEERCKEHASTGYPLPPFVRDLFPTLDDLHTTLGYINALRSNLDLDLVKLHKSTRVKMIRQIAKSRQDIYLTLFSSLLLPNAPMRLDLEEEEEDVKAKIELTKLNLEVLGKTIPRSFPKEKSAVKGFLPHAMGEENGRVVWENGVGRVVEAEGGFRGKINEGDVHVFIDHSNILYGLITHLYPSNSESLPPRHLRTLSLPCLSLLLRRGRHTPPGTLHLVASSPLKQNLDPAVRLGFEVSVLKRVEIPPEEVFDATAQHLLPRPIEHNPSPTRNKIVPGHLGNASVNGIRRYKEQGVDEILHLKILQTLNSDEIGTIVLATGDARGGQFNRDGFVGAVREALKRGWSVELWSWSEGLSRAWKEVAKREKWGGAFGIYLLDEWAEALVEVDQER